MSVQISTTWRLGAAGALSVLFLAAGCERQSAQSDYEVIDGAVEAVRADSFELTVRMGERHTGRGKDAVLACLVTGDAEVYVNDRFGSFDAISPGDNIELIGYPERGNPRSGRFVVLYAYIRRPESPPALPVLPDSASATTQPQEK